MFQIPRGTRDFTPEEMLKRRWLEDNIKTTFTSYGYKEIQTPIFENLDLFTAKSGEGIINEIYSFEDKGGRKLALRPEITAPVMRFYVEKLQMEPKPIKLFYFGNCYRYDRPQKGRYREFMQAGCELIGTDTPESYAELIAVSYNILKNAGIKNIKLKIGNLSILSTIFKKLDLNNDQISYMAPLIDKSLFDELYDVLQGYSIDNKKITSFLEIIQTSDINKIKKYVGNDIETEKEIKKLEEIAEFLKSSFNVKNFDINMNIVRGLDYYKGVVFEIEAPDLGAEKQICGGGAYELVSLFKGKETPTAGFAIGFDRILLALETEKHEFPNTSIDAYVIPLDESMINKSIEIAEALRKNKISCDIDLLRRGISKSMKHANSINAKKAVIVGPREIKENMVTIKDMKTGKQESIKIKDITKIFSKILVK